MFCLSNFCVFVCVYARNWLFFVRKTAVKTRNFDFYRKKALFVIKTDYVKSLDNF